VDQMLQRQFLRHRKHFVDRLERPRSLPQLLHRQQQYAATHRFASAQKLLPFFIGANAKNRERLVLGHPLLLDHPPAATKAASGTGGLYVELAGWEEKSQERPHSQRPGCLIMLRAFYPLIVQVFVQAPTLLEKHVAELLHVRNNPRTFPSADIQPDLRPRVHLSSRGKSRHHALVPPHRG